MASVKEIVSSLRRFVLGMASGGAYPVAKSFDRAVRRAERDERQAEHRKLDADA